MSDSITRTLQEKLGDKFSEAKFYKWLHDLLSGHNESLMIYPYIVRQFKEYYIFRDENKLDDENKERLISYAWRYFK